MFCVTLVPRSKVKKWVFMMVHHRLQSSCISVCTCRHMFICLSFHLAQGQSVCVKAVFEFILKTLIGTGGTGTDDVDIKYRHRFF